MRSKLRFGKLLQKRIGRSRRKNHPAGIPLIDHIGLRDELKGILRGRLTGENILLEIESFVKATYSMEIPERRNLNEILRGLREVPPSLLKIIRKVVNIKNEKGRRILLRAMAHRCYEISRKKSFFHRHLLATELVRAAGEYIRREGEFRDIPKGGDMTLKNILKESIAFSRRTLGQFRKDVGVA